MTTNFISLFLLVRQKFWLGQRRFEHFVRIRNPSYGVRLPDRDHRQLQVRREGGKNPRSHRQLSATQKPLPELSQPEDWKVGSAAHVGRGSWRFVLRIFVEGMAQIRETGSTSQETF